MPTTWIALVFCDPNEKGLQRRPDIVVGCCIKPCALECISKESEIQQSIEIKQEFACNAMGELRRSIAIHMPARCWMSKILLLFHVRHCCLTPTPVVSSYHDE